MKGTSLKLIYSIQETYMPCITTTPLAPETMPIKEEWLSQYQHDLVNQLGSKFTDCGKLVPNLLNKKRYVVHYRNLKLYHTLGMRVSEIHRALKFNQEAWMTPYKYI